VIEVQMAIEYPAIYSN